MQRRFSRTTPWEIRSLKHRTSRRLLHIADCHLSIRLAQLSRLRGRKPHRKAVSQARNESRRLPSPAGPAVRILSPSVLYNFQNSITPYDHNMRWITDCQLKGLPWQCHPQQTMQLLAETASERSGRCQTALCRSLSYGRGCIGVLTDRRTKWSPRTSKPNLDSKR